MACSGHRNVDYSLIWVILAIIAICALTVAGPSLSRLFQSISNELAGGEELEGLATAFQGTQHPAGTERVSSRSLLGEFTGGEQGCDFYVGEIRSYSDSQDVVLSAYSDQEVSGHPIQVQFLEGRQIPSQEGSALPESLNDVADWQLPLDVGQQQLYMVYVMVVDYGGFDCR